MEAELELIKKLPRHLWGVAWLEMQKTNKINDIERYCRSILAREERGGPIYSDSFSGFISGILPKLPTPILPAQAGYRSKTYPVFFRQGMSAAVSGCRGRNTAPAPALLRSPIRKREDRLPRT